MFLNIKPNDEVLEIKQHHHYHHYTRLLFDLDDLDAALADGVQQGLVHAHEFQLVQQLFNWFHVLIIDGQVQGAATHVVYAVHIQGGLDVVGNVSRNI